MNNFLTQRFFHAHGRIAITEELLQSGFPCSTLVQIFLSILRVTFDSFEGLSKFSKQDLLGLDKHPAKEGDFRTSEKKFKNNVGNFKFMNIKKGWIPERFNEVENEKFSFINIDVDIYKPTKESLNFFYPRLINGGCIHLDDYNFNEWPGARIAIKEFEKKNKISFSYEVPLGGYFLIK